MHARPGAGFNHIRMGGVGGANGCGLDAWIPKHFRQVAESLNAVLSRKSSCSSRVHIKDANKTRFWKGFISMCMRIGYFSTTNQCCSNWIHVLLRFYPLRIFQWITPKLSG